MHSPTIFFPSQAMDMIISNRCKKLKVKSSRTIFCISVYFMCDRKYFTQLWYIVNNFILILMFPNLINPEINHSEKNIFLKKNPCFDPF